MKKFHIGRMVRVLLFSAFIPLLVVAIVLFFYTVFRNYDYNYTTMVKNQESTLHTVNEHVLGISKDSLADVQNMDFLYFSNSGERSLLSSKANTILNALREDLTSFSEVIGVVLYNTKIDKSYTCMFTTGHDDIVSLIPETYKEILHTPRETALIPVIYEEKACLLYLVHQRYAALAVMIDPSKTDSFAALSGLSEGTIRFCFPEDVKTGRKDITTVSDDLPLALTFHIANLSAYIGLNGFQIAAILILSLLLISVVIIFIYGQNTLLKPLLELSSSFQKIADGNTAYRLGKSSRVYEIDQFYHGFDTMLNSLHEAEAETYRHETEEIKAKMQYLQMQIRPHFYLNCLKTINFLAQINETEKIQSIVISLSDYFRYSFQDVNRMVTVREELSSVGSYVELCRSLYSEIRLEVDVPEKAMELPCLPLSILTFAENCIKHRDDSDEIFLKITGTFTDDERIQFTIQNSSLFPEDILEELNSEPATAFQYKSTRVGIANVRYRLWLLYKESSSLSFSNREDLATVVLTFPTTPDHTQK